MCGIFGAFNIDPSQPADLQTLGKDPGSDREAGKTTFVDLLGVDGARARAQAVMDEGIRAQQGIEW